MMKNIQLFIILMMMMMFLTLMFILNLNLHPIYMILMLIMFSVLICMNMSIWKKNFLFSIIMFLMMISGLLIIFLYFASLISNENLSLSLNVFLITPFLLNLLIWMMFSFTFNFIFFNHFFLESKDSLNINFINKLLFNNITLIYEYPFTYLTILCMLFLLIALFSIVKLCSISSFSMRKIN